MSHVCRPAFGGAAQDRGNIILRLLRTGSDFSVRDFLRRYTACRLIVNQGFVASLSKVSMSAFESFISSAILTAIVHCSVKL